MSEVAGSAPPSAAPAEGSTGNTEGNPDGKAPPGPPPGATAAEKKILKLKVDGGEIDFDASDEEVMKRVLSKGLGADKRFNEAAQIRKQAEQIIEGLRTNPRAVLTDPNLNLGIDMRKFAEDYLWEQLQEEALTPEQKEQRAKDKELADYRESKKKAEQEAAESDERALRDHYAEGYNKSIIATLESAGLPKTPETVQRMAQRMLQAVQKGYDLEPKDLVEVVRQDYQSDIKTLLCNLDGDGILALLGDDIGKKIRESDLKRLKSPTSKGGGFAAEASRPPGFERPKASKPKAKKLASSQWRAAIAKEMLGK